MVRKKYYLLQLLQAYCFFKIFSPDPFVVSVNEAQEVSSVVLTVLASDPDSSLDMNGQVKYSFVLDNGHFIIDQNTGQVRNNNNYFKVIL